VRQQLSAAAQAPVSAKLARAVDIAGEAQRDGRQVLVFSSWTATLDLLQAALESRGILFSR
jgi:hypothetical protein